MQQRHHLVDERTGLRAREERAKRICLDCPVLNRCREHALSARAG
ncbi:WhiB family transcriptional regulator [Mycolicibacterium lacusdiani]